MLEGVLDFLGFLGFSGFSGFLVALVDLDLVILNVGLFLTARM
jgi:hypothetical protein